MPFFINTLTRPNYPEVERLLEAASRLGYCLVGVARRPGEKPVEASRGRARAVSVYVVEGESRRDVALALERVPRGYPVIVEAKAVDAARYASVNKRVLGFIVRPGSEKLVDRSTSRLFRERGWGLVAVPLPTSYRDPFSRRAWRALYVALRRAFAYGIDVALVSEAVDHMALWHPRSAAGVGEVVGVPWEVSASWVSSSPARNLEKAYRLSITSR